MFWKKIVIVIFLVQERRYTVHKRKWPETGHLLSFHQYIQYIKKNSSNWLNLVLHPNKAVVCIGLIIERRRFVNECLKRIIILSKYFPDSDWLKAHV